MDAVILLIVAAIAGAAFALGRNVERGRTPAPPPPPSPEAPEPPPEPPVAVADAAPPPATEPQDAPPASTTEQVFALAAALDPFYQQSGHPRDLRERDEFRRGVAVFRASDLGSDRLLEYMVGSNVLVAAMALEAVCLREDAVDVRSFVLEHFDRVSYGVAYYALRALAERVAAPVVADVLVRAGSDWLDPLPLSVMREFVARRIERGESPSFDGVLDSTSIDREEGITKLVERLGDLIPGEMRDALRLWRDDRVDTVFLGTIGRVWDAAELESYAIVGSRGMDESVGQLEAALRSTPPRPVALVGQSGVGKTTLVRALARRLIADGWTIFESGGTELMAGQMYIGQIDERVQSLLRAIGGKRVLWVVPAFQDLLWAGSYRGNPTGILDRLLPYLERGSVALVGEMTPAAYETVIQAKPQLRSILAHAQVLPPSDADSLALARRWATLRGEQRRAGAATAAAQPVIADDVLREASQLATQYLNDRAAPGNLLHLLGATYTRLAANVPDDASIAIRLEDVLVTLSQLTGLPLSVLDEREGLDIPGLRAFFQQRVIGQPEAVECLVERIAMIKAGVNDPRRPIGVFLFVGPTGTGKTEIAKTLTRYLFGSPDRMIRLDMSELQAPNSIDRIIGGQGDDGGSESGALVNAIRRQPFSVVLLDEFEKANPNIWDLFLQVFDDGRLSDRRGNVADFRHAVIILTSNLGATLPHGTGIGFSPGAGGFSTAAVDRAVGEAFRREFVNRIDRVVIFRPLSRAEMREILRKELNEVLTRRGFRNRSWAVEWDASAIDFLLEKGFTPDLGARPLRRAVERYVLAPLAVTIVAHQVPAGEQFLFVRREGDRLDVVFIDPDAPDDEIEAATTDIGEGEAPTLDLRSIVLEPHGSADELDLLEERFDALATQVESPEWERKKADALATMRAPGFWESPDRFAVLGVAEYMDRIEVGFETAGSLLRRLVGPAHQRGRRHQPRDLVRRLAQQLYLLEAGCSGLAAGEPQDAFVLVRAARDSGADGVLADDFAKRLAEMYREWARQRRMRLEVVDEVRGNGETPYAALFAISGFGAYLILRPESGVHVLETPQDAKSFNRVRARVIVAAQPDAPADTPKAARLQGYAAVDALREDETAQLVVRRYREEPSPLVRDAVRQWRTGRIDRVFGGEFDVIQ